MRFGTLDSTLRRAVGLFLLVSGLVAWLSVTPWWPGATFRFAQEVTFSPGSPQLSLLSGRYVLETLEKFKLTGPQGGEVTVYSGAYRHSDGRLRRVLVPISESDRSTGGEVSEAWRGVKAFVQRETPSDALFMTWWDNGQRLHFLTGREVIADQAVGEGFRSDRERQFWAAVSGDLARSPEILRRLAFWYASDADEALEEIRQAYPKRAVYLLTTIDDLARLEEIQRLAGKELAFDPRIFPVSVNLHGQIAAVGSWAKNQAPGNYLVKRLGHRGILAWRSRTPAGSDTLLARLLPFGVSLAEPMPQLERVFESPQKDILIFRLAVES